MPIVVSVKEFLESLKANELSKVNPGDRIEVPNISQLADDIGVERHTLSRTVNNKFKNPNINQVAAIIAALRRRGFRCDVGDVLRFVD